MITIRAVLAVGVLGGYWLGRYLLPGALLLGAGWLWFTGTPYRALLLGGLTVLGTALSVRAGRALRGCAAAPPSGVLVQRRADSPLWNDVVGLCRRLDVPLPEEIRLGAEPAVEVLEHPRRFGLVGGPRSLYLGLPLLTGLRADQLRALLTHELAHGSRQAGTLRAVCHRARSTVGAMAAHRPATAGVVFAGWARLFLALEWPVSQDQEYHADRAAVRLTGRGSLGSALRELPALVLAWRRYLTEAIEPAVRRGYAPLSLTDGFHHTKQQWYGELTRVSVAPPAPASPPWDAHPPLAERLHAIHHADEAPSQDPAPVGRDLLRAGSEAPAVHEVEQAVLGRQVRRVPWEEFRAITAGESLRTEVQRLYATAGVSDIDGILALLEAGGLPDLVARSQPPTLAAVRRLLSVAFAQAAVDGGVGRWRRIGAGELTVVRPDGGAIPVDELAARVVADPATVPVVREVVRTVRTAAPTRA